MDVDPTHGKVYWTTWTDQSVRRANLDGSGAEDLMTSQDGVGITYGIALAVDGLCGDGILDRFEECDDGNVIDGDGCQSECALPLCGDGVLDAGEACDDDNAQSCDGCSDTCSIEVGLVCGDGILNAVCGEECDDGNTQDADGCQGNCLLPLCGDSILDPDEDCDDGNLELCDGCSSSCAFEPGFICGDGTANAACGEECEDGNTDSCDGCSAICTVEPGPVCGDGIVNPLCEECDDGNGLAGDRCEADCTLAPGLPVEVFHDQTDLPGSYGTPDDLVELGYVEYSSEAADDFRIISQSRWAITEVSTRGTSYNAEIASVDIAFHANSDGQPAEVSVCSFSELTSYTDDSGNLTISLPFPCTLDPGVYWLVQQVRMDDSAGWHEWSNRTELTGNEAVWRNPGGGYTWNCVDWTPLTACDGLWGGEPDLLFQISGVELGGAVVPVFGPLGLFFIVIGLGGTGCRMLVRRHRPSQRRSPDDPRNTEHRAAATTPVRNT
jgi:cysteine-rich repeat protein